MHLQFISWTIALNLRLLGWADKPFSLALTISVPVEKVSVPVEKVWKFRPHEPKAVFFGLLNFIDMLLVFGSFWNISLKLLAKSVV